MQSQSYFDWNTPSQSKQSDIESKCHSLLRQHFKYDSYRENQLEVILKSKDEALRSALESRDALDHDPHENSTFSQTLDRIIEIQGRNAQTLENLLKEQTKKKEETKEGANRLRKVREAYSSHLGTEGKRLKV